MTSESSETSTLEYKHHTITLITWTRNMLGRNSMIIVAWIKPNKKAG